MTQRIFWSITALFLWGLAGTAGAETVPRSSIRQNLFTTCTSPTGQRWIVGELGRIYSTKDNGQTVQQSEVDSKEAFLSIACATDGALFISGQHGMVMRSRDNGKSWQKLETGTDRWLLSVRFADANVGIAVGDYGIIVRTENGGDSWTRVALPADIPLPEDIAEIIQPGDVLLYGADFVSPSQGWIVGEFGVILTTVDGGRTWTAQQSPVETTLFGVTFDGPLRGWAVGIEEVLLHTEDGGITWNRQHVPPREGFVLALYNVAVVGNVGWAVGDSGLLLRSTNGGRSWERVQLPIQFAANWLRGIDLNNDDEGLIVGGNGIMIATQGDQFRKLGE